MSKDSSDWKSNPWIVGNHIPWGIKLMNGVIVADRVGLSYSPRSGTPLEHFISVCESVLLQRGADPVYAAATESIALNSLVRSMFKKRFDEKEDFDRLGCAQ